MLALIPLLPLVGFLINASFGRRFKQTPAKNIRDNFIRRAVDE